MHLQCDWFHGWRQSLAEETKVVRLGRLPSSCDINGNPCHDFERQKKPMRCLLTFFHFVKDIGHCIIYILSYVCLCVDVFQQLEWSEGQLNTRHSFSHLVSQFQLIHTWELTWKNSIITMVMCCPLSSFTTAVWCSVPCSRAHSSWSLRLNIFPLLFCFVLFGSSVRAPLWWPSWGKLGMLGREKGNWSVGASSNHWLVNQWRTRWIAITCLSFRRSSKLLKETEV